MLANKRMSFILVAFSLLVAMVSFPFGTAWGAGEPTSLKTVRLWVNPEYDDPRVLTMVEGQIVGVTAPALVRFLVPTNAEMYSAGFKDAQGTYQRAPDWDGVSNIKPSGIDGWNVVSFTINAATFRTEWYEDAIQGLPDKKISYDFRTLYPISDLSVVIQRPTKATNFLVSPKEQSSFNDSGFQVFKYSLSNIAKDATVHYDISYTKTDSKPSISQNQTGSEGSGKGSSTTVWLAVGFGGILAIALIFVFMQGGSRRRSAPARGRRAQPAARRGASGGAKRFCTECGAGIQGQSKFCPECGKRMQ